MSAHESDETRPGRPLLRVVRGDPTPEEVAALVAVVAARQAAAARAAVAASRKREPRSAWRDRSRDVRSTLPHGPGAWRASALPR